MPNLGFELLVIIGLTLLNALSRPFCAGVS
jgi:hypothetical protein